MTHYYAHRAVYFITSSMRLANQNDLYKMVSSHWLIYSWFSLVGHFLAWNWIVFELNYWKSRVVFFVKYRGWAPYFWQHPVFGTSFCDAIQKGHSRPICSIQKQLITNLYFPISRSKLPFSSAFITLKLRIPVFHRFTDIPVLSQLWVLLWNWIIS